MPQLLPSPHPYRTHSRRVYAAQAVLIAVRALDEGAAPVTLCQATAERDSYDLRTLMFAVDAAFADIADDEG